MADEIAYTTQERLVQDFASRGLVLLAPESLGLPLNVHERIFAEQKRAHEAGKRPWPADIPEVLDVINSPGVVTACNQIVGENWAVVPAMHCAPFTSGARNQHWHKDDNGPYNSRKQRHHQAVQIELLYYPQAVREDMGPTATVPYSQYLTFNHEENQDNFAGADHLDFNYHISGMEAEAISGPDSKFDVDDIIHGRTAHDIRMREAVENTKWPLVRQFEVASLRAGSVVIYSHNLFHRGNHRRDDWRTWEDNPRFMWRFWLYRTTDPAPTGNDRPAEVSWNRLGVDPLTQVDLDKADNNAAAVWRYHNHWIRTAQPPPPRPEAERLSTRERGTEADRLSVQLYAMHEEAEPARVGAAYQLASIGDTALAVRLLGHALGSERESVRRAATYGLIAVGEDATKTFLEATSSPVKWIRKAGVYGLGDASPLTAEVLNAVVNRLRDDPSVYVRAVAAGTLGCLGRRAAATGIGASLVPACLGALVQSLGREENRPAMDRAQQRSIKFVRPTDDCDVCEGNGVDFGLERFELVRSAVKENALWSVVILSSHGTAIMGDALEPVVDALSEVVCEDENVISVCFALDALNRLANLPSPGEDVPNVSALKEKFAALLAATPMQSWESLVRGGLNPPAVAG
jgi:hypothetical protein